VPLRRNEVLCGKRNRIREVDSEHDLEKTVCKTRSNHRRRHHGISPCLYPAVTCGLGKKTVIHPNVDKGRVKNNLAFLHVGRNSVIPVRKYFMLLNLDVFEDIIWDRFSGFINLLY